MQLVIHLIAIFLELSRACAIDLPATFLTGNHVVQQPRPQGLLACQNGGDSGEDPGTQQITCLQRGWRCIQNGGYGEKGEKNWVRDVAKVKINKMAGKAEVQFKKK